MHFSTPATLRYVCEYFCELLGSILPACLVWEFVASFVIILLIQQHGQFEISLAILK